MQRIQRSSHLPRYFFPNLLEENCFAKYGPLHALLSAVLIDVAVGVVDYACGIGVLWVCVREANNNWSSGTQKFSSVPATKR